MKAILPLPTGGVGLVDTAPPAIGPGEVLLEMRASGLCGTDLAKLAGSVLSPDVRLGHEIAGVVRAVGDGVARFKPGDRMTAAHHVPCGTCWACRHGNDSMCPQFKATQIDPCGFAELIRIPAPHVGRVAFRLPETLSDEAASFTEPLACAVRAVRRSQVMPGDRIAVVGAGGMGLLIAQAVLATGAVPIVADVADGRLELAQRVGVERLVHSAQDGLGAGLRAQGNGAPVDGAVLTVVNAGILSEIQGAVRPGGRINIFAGAAGGPFLPLDFVDLYHRELAVFSTYSSNPTSLAEAFDLLATGRVSVVPLISHRLPLAAFADGLRLQREGRATKVIFHP
jgi:L-iditol 2-dehydrogenase